MIGAIAFIVIGAVGVAGCLWARNNSQAQQSLLDQRNHLRSFFRLRPVDWTEGVDRIRIGLLATAFGGALLVGFGAYALVRVLLS